MLKGVYTPKYHQDQLYYNIFKNHWNEFVRLYPDRFETEYGKLEEYQRHSVENFIQCGDPKHGFAYLECPNCHEAIIVPFSCKSKVCNSCGEKHALVWSEWVASEVMMNCNHRHITATIPTEIRPYFYKNGLLLKKYLQTACDTINFIYTKNCSDKTAKVGIIAVLQTSGSSLNYNPHCHILLTEGLISNKLSEEGEIITYQLAQINFKYLNLLWRNKVLSLLRNFNIIDDSSSEIYKKKYPTGFHVDVRFKQTYDNKEERELLAQYLIRQPIGNSRIEYYNQELKQVTIRYKAETNNETGKNIYRLETMDVYDFIARRIQHILPYHMQKVRFIGLYSNKYRGQHKKIIKELNPDSQGIKRNEWNSSWRRLIWKIYDTDPIMCTNCGEEMKIKDIFTTRAERKLKELINLKFYIRGHWREEQRKAFIKPLNQWERRKKVA